MECDQGDPLVFSDEESGCGSEEETTSCMTPSPGNSVQIVVTLQEQLHFTLSALLVAISTSAVVITLPLYMESITVDSDIYCSLFFTGAIGTIILTVLSVMCYIYSREIQPQVNIPCLRVLRIGVLKGMAGAIVLFSVDRKRVLCHLQDPILGICLAFSLSFYFLFCEKVMGLQRIFGAMVIIVGVFISVDYQLCNELRCHGNERMANPTTVPEHTSAWAWGYHLAWAIICAVGLALWALAYALLENDIIKFKKRVLKSVLKPRFASTFGYSFSSGCDTRVGLKLSSSPQQHLHC
ncbi:hypothetical protein B566_EDAN008123 [Ephemera danica]|nr:hypothetical protein B566_EDAN008123 [Ephemera danica]